MSEMGKLAEKLKRGRPKARKAEREGKTLPDWLSNMASNQGCNLLRAVHLRTKNICQPLFPADESTKDETPRTGYLLYTHEIFFLSFDYFFLHISYKLFCLTDQYMSCPVAFRVTLHVV